MKLVGHDRQHYRESKFVCSRYATFYETEIALWSYAPWRIIALIKYTDIK